MFCKTFASTISCEVCIKRQKMAQKLGKRKILLFGKDSLIYCFDCPYGKMLLEENSKKYSDRDINQIKKEAFTKFVVEKIKSGTKCQKLTLNCVGED